VSSPSVDQTSNVTIKFGGKFEDPWLVVYGNPATIKEQILEAFDWDDQEELRNLNLAELIVEANTFAQGAWTAAKKLGGSVVPGGAGSITIHTTDPAPTADEVAEKVAEKVQERAQGAATRTPAQLSTPAPAEAPASTPLTVEAIQAVTTKGALAALLREHKSELTTNLELRAAAQHKAAEF